MRRAILLTAALWGCGQLVDEPARSVVIDFEGIVDPTSGSITVSPGVSALGLVSVAVDQNGIPNNGPPNTVELVTEAVGSDGSCGYPASFCGTVRLRSFYDRRLDNAFVQIYYVSPATHPPLNAVPSQMGLSNTYGLWSYGSLLPNGGNNTRRWVFASDGSAFRIKGRVYADIAPLGSLFVLTGAGQVASSLYRVNPATGDATFIGVTGYAHMSGLDFDPTTGILYAHRNTLNGPQELYTLNPDTGAATLVGATNIQSSDLSFDNTGGLWAWSSFSGIAADDLARVDKSTGAVTLIPSELVTSRTGLFTHPDGAIIVKAGATLYRIDTNTGATTLMGTITGMPTPHNPADVDPATGLLYVVLRGVGTDLYRVDLATFAATLVGPIRADGQPLADVGAIAFR